MRSLAVYFATLISDHRFMDHVAPDLNLSPTEFYKKHWQLIAESTGHWNKSDLKILAANYLNFMRCEE